MESTLSAQDEAFRVEVRTWMSEHLIGESKALGTGTDMGEEAELDVRKAWERELASGGWVGMGWPKEYGGRDLPLLQRLIFNEEYARSGGPARAGFFGEQLLGPTIMAFGTDQQKQRFLPPILRAEEYWCQGFSEPLMGADGQILTDGQMGDYQYTFQFSRSHTIYAGSSEIQRNIVGERVLGLPREPG